MNKFSMILSALLVLTLLVMIAPNILALNRGKMLRNIALWLAIILGLALVYQNFGPGKDHALPFGTSSDKDDGGDSASSDVPAGDQGYTPPKE
jgi:hypothetical protein